MSLKDGTSTKKGFDPSKQNPPTTDKGGRPKHNEPSIKRSVKTVKC